MAVNTVHPSTISRGTGQLRVQGLRFRVQGSGFRVQDGTRIKAPAAVTNAARYIRNALCLRV